MKHTIAAVLMVLAFAGTAAAQNLAPEGYVYNEAKVRWERPGQQSDDVQAPGDGGTSGDAAGDGGSSCGDGNGSDGR